MRVLLAGAALAALVAAAEPASHAFTIGVLRRDAIVVPIATYDGKNWKGNWPYPASDVDVPVSLASVPRRWWGPTGPLVSWQISSGSTSQTVHVRQPDWLQTYCQKQVGLRTDYQPREWPPGPDAKPYPKDGLAVSPPVKVEPIERIAPGSPEEQALGEGVRAAFNARELDGVARAQQQGADVAPGRKDLEALPVTIEAAYAFGGSHRVYWAEATREYKKKNGTCGAVLFGSGWFLIDGEQLAFISFQVDVVPCSRQGLTYMLPLGVLTLPRGVYWIAQWSGWDHEEYAVVEVGAKAVTPVLRIWGGGC